MYYDNDDMESIGEDAARLIQKYLDENCDYEYEVKWVTIETAPTGCGKYEIWYEAYDCEMFRTVRDHIFIDDEPEKSDFIGIARDLERIARHDHEELNRAMNS